MDKENTITRVENCILGNGKNSIYFDIRFSILLIYIKLIILIGRITKRKEWGNIFIITKKDMQECSKMIKSTDRVHSFMPMEVGTGVPMYKERNMVQDNYMRKMQFMKNIGIQETQKAKEKLMMLQKISMTYKEKKKVNKYKCIQLFIIFLNRNKS